MRFAGTWTSWAPASIARFDHVRRLRERVHGPRVATISPSFVHSKARRARQACPIYPGGRPVKAPLLYRALAIAGLAVLILLPISMIGGKISERQARAQGVVAQFATQTSG